MNFIRRRRHAKDEQRQQYRLLEQEHQELLRYEAAQLRANQLSVTERLVHLLEERYVGHMAKAGLERVRPYRLKTVIGGTVFPEPDESGIQKINIDIAKDQSFVAIEACGVEGSQSYMYIHDDEHAFLRVDDARLPLTDPRAKNGLERFRKVCEVLGVTASVATT